MKSLKYVFILLFLSCQMASASYNDVLIADIQYDWINKSMVEKESIISEVHDILFENDMTTQKDLKKTLKE